MKHIVSFETAKFLLELGYDEGSRYGYLCSGELKEPYFGEFYKNSDTTNDVCYEAPGILEAVDWLEQNKGLIFTIDQTSIKVASETTLVSTPKPKTNSISELLNIALALYEKHYELFEKSYNPVD